MKADTMSARKKRGKIDWAGEFKGVLLLILAVFALHSLVAKPFFIPSGSMLPTMWVGDRLVVSKWPYGWSYASASFHLLPYMEGRLFGRLPERGDIVIVKPPGQRADYIKRVIGLPGDTIAVEGGRVYLNGKPLPRKPMAPALLPRDANFGWSVDYDRFAVTMPDGTQGYAIPRYLETLPNGRRYQTLDIGDSTTDDYDPIVVPDGHIFLMGDNRDDSADSRVDPMLGGLGLVPVENIGGRAEFITFSLDDGVRWYNPLTWWSSLRGDRAWNSLRSNVE
jgi:signal peptidase I